MAAVAFDINGTIDADPATFQALMSALVAAGHQVYVLTGSSSPTVTKQDRAEKKHYLEQLGCGQSYTKLKVFPDPPHKAKAKFCQKYNVNLLFDNSVKNAQLASKFCTVVLPWNNKAD